MDFVYYRKKYNSQDCSNDLHFLTAYPLSNPHDATPFAISKQDILPEAENMSATCIYIYKGKKRKERRIKTMEKLRFIK